MDSHELARELLSLVPTLVYTNQNQLVTGVGIDTSGNIELEVQDVATVTDWPENPV